MKIVNSVPDQLDSSSVSCTFFHSILLPFPAIRVYQFLLDCLWSDHFRSKRHTSPLPRQGSSPWGGSTPTPAGERPELFDRPARPHSLSAHPPPTRPYVQHRNLWWYGMFYDEELDKMRYRHCEISVIKRIKWKQLRYKNNIFHSAS
jgi:hypothetical protein